MTDQRFALRVMSTLGLRGAIIEMTPVLTRRGLDFSASYGATNVLMPRLTVGEGADVVVLTDAAIEALMQRGTIAAGSRRDLARSPIGIAVKAGAAKPDIRTVASLRQTMLAARSVAFSKCGASGVHFAELIQTLGIAEEVNAKARVFDGVVGELVARGHVEIAVQQVSELKLVDGIEVVGPLPDELQKITVFSAGVIASTTRPAAAGLFVTALATPEAKGVMRRQGLEPIDSVG
ncbi:MAG TPA: substrate-binding domain-containing protein [Xanthobacteraceae bacterium]|jgi:molybdate transport system substrate-binding protein